MLFVRWRWLLVSVVVCCLVCVLLIISWLLWCVGCSLLCVVLAFGVGCLFVVFCVFVRGLSYAICYLLMFLVCCVMFVGCWLSFVGCRVLSLVVCLLSLCVGGCFVVRC